MTVWSAIAICSNLENKPSPCPTLKVSDLPYILDGHTDYPPCKAVNVTDINRLHGDYTHSQIIWTGPNLKAFLYFS